MPRGGTGRKHGRLGRGAGLDVLWPRGLCVHPSFAASTCTSRGWTRTRSRRTRLPLHIALMDPLNADGEGALGWLRSRCGMVDGRAWPCSAEAAWRGPCSPCHDVAGHARTDIAYIDIAIALPGLLSASSGMMARGLPASTWARMALLCRERDFALSSSLAWRECGGVGRASWLVAAFRGLEGSWRRDSCSLGLECASRRAVCASSSLLWFASMGPRSVGRWAET